ncbi:MAG: DUF58 domain-containing protein [Chloroflexia bacterium]
MRAFSNLRLALASRRVQNPKSKIQNPKLVDGEYLRKLDRLSLSVGRELINGLMGEHLAVRRTTGIEFADYRQYSAGDDLRRVDWNAYARLGTLHVRQAQAEHDTALYLLVDSSPSMEFGQPTKFFAARKLAAGIGYIALAHLDSLILATPGRAEDAQLTAGQGQSHADYDSALRTPNAALRGRAEAGTLFRSLQEMRSGGVAPFDNILLGWSTGMSVAGAGGRTGRVAVIVSDLLLDEYKEGVRRLVASGFQVTLMHILSAEELRPPGDGELELIDSETGEKLEVHLGVESIAEYNRRLNTWLEGTQEWCRNNGAGYILMESGWDIERMLLETLRRRGVTV